MLAFVPLLCVYNVAAASETFTAVKWEIEKSI